MNRNYRLATIRTGADCHHSYAAERMKVAGQQAVAVLQRIPVSLAQSPRNVAPVTGGMSLQ